MQSKGGREMDKLKKWTLEIEYRRIGKKIGLGLLLLHIALFYGLPLFDAKVPEVVPVNILLIITGFVVINIRSPR
jgi:regulator of sirC expression with transglutaminase-like and TPR domain